MSDTVDSGSYTPETVLRRQKIAEMLLGESLKAQPIRHWAEGLAQMARAGVGGYLGNQANEEAKAGEKAQNAALMSMLGGGSPASASPPAAPISAPALDDAPAPQVDASLPRGLRNNNPLNIEAGNFTQGQPGFSGSDGRFAKFNTPEAGVGAANKLLDTYQNKYGLNTPAGIVGRWAPAGDGNNVSAYAGNVAKQLGIGPNDPVPPEMRPQLISAMGQHENGRPIGDVAKALMAPQGAPQQPPQQMAQNAPPSAAAVPQMPGAAGDNKAAIAKMLNDPNPYVQRMGRQLATAAVQKQITAQPKFHKLNDEMLFEEGSGKTMPAGPGFKPLTDPAQRASFGIPPEDKRPYQVGPGNKLINPPAETRLNIDQRGEAAFDTAAAKHQAERFDKLVSGGMDAKQMTADLGALKDIGSRITTGKTAEMTAALGPYAEALGVKVDGLDDLQAYKSIVAKLAPRMRVVGSGATSDYEMRQFLEALPGLGKTQGGNEMISTTLQALQDHKESAAEIASRAMNKELTPREADKMLRELPDPLTAWKKNNGVTTLKAGSGGSNLDDLLKKYGGK